MKLQIGQEIVFINILPYISRNRDNQAMVRKLGQLREYNMRNIFLEKSNKNMVEKFVPDSFMINQN